MSRTLRAPTATSATRPRCTFVPLAVSALLHYTVVENSTRTRSYIVRKRFRSSVMQIVPREHASRQNVLFARHCANVQAFGRQNRNGKQFVNEKCYKTLYIIGTYIIIIRVFPCIVSEARRKDQLLFEHSKTRDLHQLCARKASRESQGVHRHRCGVQSKLEKIR